MRSWYNAQDGSLYYQEQTPIGTDDDSSLSLDSLLKIAQDSLPGSQLMSVQLETRRQGGVPAASVLASQEYILQVHAGSGAILDASAAASALVPIEAFNGGPRPPPASGQQHHPAHRRQLPPYRQLPRRRLPRPRPANGMGGLGR